MSLAQKLCVACGLSFRGSLAKETLCAKCTVDKEPLPTEDDMKNIDAYFADAVQRQYGSNDPQVLAASLHFSDLLNHSKRIQKVKERNEGQKSNKKERNRTNREISRLSEENAVIQDRLKKCQDKMLALMLLQGQKETAQKPKSPKIPKLNEDKPPPKDDVDNSVQKLVTVSEGEKNGKSDDYDSEELNDDNSITLVRRNSVKQIVAAMQKKVQSSPTKAQEVPSSPTKPISTKASPCPETPSSVAVSITVATPPSPKPITIDIEEESDQQCPTPEGDTTLKATSDNEEDTDDLPRLSRSNSVKERIAAFENMNKPRLSHSVSPGAKKSPSWKRFTQ